MSGPRRSAPRRLLRANAVIGLLLGAVAGYFTGAYLACEVVMPESNLCGLPGALIAAPIGAVVGLWLATRIRMPRRDDETAGE